MPKKFMPIAAAFAPNYKLQDVIIAKKNLFLPWNWGKWQNGEYIQKLEKCFAEYMEQKEAVSFSSGRAGFYTILKGLGIKPNDEIILQSFTTVALPNIIRSFGAIPVFIDIKPGSFNIDPEKIEERITPNTRAIIIQHTFGEVAPIEKILEIAKKNQIYTIEDCAHSLGAKYNGVKAGKFADAAFFSFGRDKVISSVSGGMVIAKSDEMLGKIKLIQKEMNFPDRRSIARNLAHPIITVSSLFTYNLFSLGKIIMFLATKLKLINRAYSNKEKHGEIDMSLIGKMPNVLAEIALNQMNYLENFNAHRLHIAQFYEKNIINEKIQKPATNSNQDNIYLWYTILTDNKKEIIEKAAEKNIILGDWFPQTIGPESVDLEKAGYQRSSCPISEEVSSKCINLPTHHNIEEKQAQKVTDFINSL